MADKIVTLEDKNNDKLYPVAGALFQNAVTTASIQNNAVTSDKIDWATSVEDLSIVPNQTFVTDSRVIIKKFGPLVLYMGTIRLTGTAQYLDVVATLSSPQNLITSVIVSGDKLLISGTDGAIRSNINNQTFSGGWYPITGVGFVQPT